MNIKTLILLGVSTIALCSCATSQKPVNDCSTIFEDIKQNSNKKTEQNPANANGEENQEPEACKVLKIKVNKDTSCEISGSESVDKLVELYQNDNDPERMVLISPIKSLDASDVIENYDTILTYYKVLNNVKDHVSSDVFKTLEDYNYKGIKCESKGNKFVGWIGEGQFVASYNGQVTSAKAKKTNASKTSTAKPSASKKANNGEVKVKNNAKQSNQ